MKSTSKFLPLILAVSLPVIAFGEDSSSYEEIVVSAARIPQNIGQTLSSVEVITAEDIELSQATALPELLRNISGFQYDSNGGRGAAAGISIRGMSSKHTLVLVDGVRVSSATLGATALEQIPVEMIERIEVVKGPKSSLYGSDALGGVIHIFTKRANQTVPHVEVGYGSHSTADISTGFGFSNESTSISTNLAYEKGDGYSRLEDAIGADADSDGYEERSLAIAAQHQTGDNGVISGQFLLSDSTSEVDSGSFGDQTESQNRAANIGYDFQASTDLSVGLALNYAVDESDTQTIFASYIKTTRTGASALANYQLGDERNLVFAYDYESDSVDSTQDYAETDRDNHSLSGQYLADFGIVSTQLGLRYDDNEAYGSTTTGNIALGSQMSDSLSATISYGTAFKAPSFNDLYWPAGLYSAGNPDVQPEESETLEIYLQGDIQGLYWSASLYNTEVENLIQWAAGEDFVWRPTNVANAQMQGADIDLGFNVNNWNAALSYSFVEAEDSATGEQLEKVARNKVSLDLDRSFNQLDLGLTAYSQDERMSGGEELGGYLLLDLRARYRINEAVRISANLKNISDKDYQLVSGYQTDGRTASLSLHYNF